MTAENNKSSITGLLCYFGAATNHRTRRVSVDRDTEITLILTIARSLHESSTKDLTRPALEIVFRRTCPLVDGAAIVWY